MPTVEQIRRAVDGYVDSFNRQDRRKFLELLADNVQQIDPVGSLPNVGRRALAAFWDGLYATVDKIDFRIVDLFISGDEAALVFRILQHAPGSTTEVNGIDVFTVSDSGLITLVKGYTDADHIRTSGNS